MITQPHFRLASRKCTARTSASASASAQQRSYLPLMALFSALLTTSTTSRSCGGVVRAWLSSPTTRRIFVRGGASSSSSSSSSSFDPHHHTRLQQQQQQQKQLYATGSSSITPPPPPPPPPSLSSPTTTADETVPSMSDIAQRLANDALMESSQRQFGGLDYFDTSIDQRFRTIFVLGGPGAGKGTQCGYMVDETYPVSHFSVGELLRQADNTNPHKSIIDECLQNGQIVPVQVSLSLLKSAMENAATQQTDVLYLVDGFPRNRDNLSGWATFMDQTCVLATVLVYTCPLDVLEKRILARNQGRSDDTVAAVQKRFRTFADETMPVVRALQSVASHRWRVVEIDGNRAVGDVWATTRECLHQLLMNDVITANQRLLTAAFNKDAATYMALCDPHMFRGDRDNVDDDTAATMTTAAIEAAFTKTEGTADSNVVENARVVVINGRNVAVTYDRTMNGGVRLREKRIWSHQGRHGWRNIHYQRTPAGA